MLASELVSRWSQRDASPAVADRGLKARRTLDRPTRGEFPCGLEIETPRGNCWRNDIPVGELWPEQERWLAALARRSPASEGDADGPHEEIVALREALPERVLLIDVEMCDDAIFLIGAVHTHKGLPIATQLLARSAAEEPAILTALAQILAGKAVLTTFNGKALDWPTILERRRHHRLAGSDEPIVPVHCDLLHHARRRWKSRLPNCKLQTLEQAICGRHRGAAGVRDVSQAYHDYAASGDAAHLSGVLHHNALDLITLWQLALWLAYA